MKQIIPIEAIKGNVNSIKFNLSSGTFTNKTNLNYIPRNADIFNGDIKANFLKTFPNIEQQTKPMD